MFVKLAKKQLEINLDVSVLVIILIILNGKKK